MNQKTIIITLCERLRTHKFFTKDQCFYLNYRKFSIKSYVLDHFDPVPRFPPFLLYVRWKSGVNLYGDVSVMKTSLEQKSFIDR